MNRLAAFAVAAVGTVAGVTSMTLHDAQVPVTGTIHEQGADADSFHLDASNGESIEFRLAGGVDAPEIEHKGLHIAEQPGGEAARQALLDFVRHDPVTCTPTGAATHGRGVAYCSVRGIDLSTWLLSHGWAMATRYGRCKDTLPLVQRAQAEKLGIFGTIPADARVPPSIWRGHASDLCKGETP